MLKTIRSIFRRTTPSDQTLPLPDHNGDQWAYRVVERLALASLTEQRRARKWGIFFKLLTFIYLGWILYQVSIMEDWVKLSGASISGKHTALIKVEGVIDNDADANANDIIDALRDAFEDPDTSGVILHINSPGGSAVQSNLIYQEVRRLRKDHPDIHLYAVIADLCASGGYYIASAADEIYANEASLVGSIGVIMNGFGFVESLQKLGVERRLLTAGENKALLDPFSPQNPQQVSHIQTLLDQIHQQFINAVKAGRGERLKEDATLFSGLIWNGEEAQKMGLIDGFGSMDYVAKEIIQAENIVDFTLTQDYWDQFAERVGTSLLQSWLPVSKQTQGIGVQYLYTH